MGVRFRRPFGFIISVFNWFFGRGDWMAGEGTRQCSLGVGMRADYS